MTDTNFRFQLLLNETSLFNFLEMLRVYNINLEAFNFVMTNNIYDTDLITNNPNLTRQILNKLRYNYNIGRVILTDVRPIPGEALRILNVARQNNNLIYAELTEKGQIAIQASNFDTLKSNVDNYVMSYNN